MRHISKQRECSYGRSAKSCCYRKLHCCSRGRKTTTRLQICSSRGKRARAQLKVVSNQLMEESLSRPRCGSRSLLNPSSCMMHSKYMTTNVLMLSQSWIIRCGPRMPTVRHVFCASLPQLAYWSVTAPQEFLQKGGKADVVSKYGQA